MRHYECDSCKACDFSRGLFTAETDFYLMPDYPISDKNLESIKAYRQALRDVPQQEGFPLQVNWPDKPLIESV